MKKIIMLFALCATTAYGNDVARTIYNEARGEGELGMRAVATVIYNRASRSRPTSALGWNAELVKVVSAPHQFCGYRPQLSVADLASIEYALALQIANELAGRQFEPLGTWTHFYNPALASPRWGNSMEDVVIIGNHKFGRTR